MHAISNVQEYSVSEISGRVKRLVEDAFGYVRVRGEISMAKVNAASGHCYLALKDDKALLDAVCWKGTMSKLAHKPQAGMEVIATGRLTTYPGSSKYQLVIESLEPAGIGALMAMLEARKKALEAEGLFRAERKKPLPYLPEVIGIITSPTGAVIRDILHRLADRFPRHVLLWPVPVQGQGAAEKIAAAIGGFNNMPPGATRPDVIIVARGGGSIEDLWAFNEEVVVRAAAASAIPLISAVGHETDTTLIDFAADRRAPTPTAAAEMAVPVRAALLAYVEELVRRQKIATRKLIGHQAERIEHLARGLPRPQQLVAAMMQTLDALAERLMQAMPRLMTRRHEQVLATAAALSPRFLAGRMQAQQQACTSSGERLRLAVVRALHQQEQRLTHTAAMLASLNVLGVLKRGFVLAKTTQGRVIAAASAMPETGALILQFHDGERMVTAAGAAPAPRARATKPAPQPGLFDS